MLRDNILRAVPVPKIPAGEYRDVVVIWGLPDDMIYSSGDNYTEKHHFCLTARVLDQFDDDTYDPSVTYFDVRGSNDIAQKNVIHCQQTRTGTRYKRIRP